MNKRRASLLGVSQDRGSGLWKVDKWFEGKRLRGSFSDLESANRFVFRSTEEIRKARLYGMRPEMTLFEAGCRFIKEKIDAGKPTAVTYGNILVSIFKCIDQNTNISEISDITLKPWRAYRLKNGKPASSKTIGEGIKLVSSILKAASSRWVVPGTNLNYLEKHPSLTIPKQTSKTSPRPITWQEQDRLLVELPEHLVAMAVFALNTGAREAVVANLKWDWYITDTESGRPCFYIPEGFVKGRRNARLLLLNRAAQEVVDAQFGKHPDYVFVYRRALKTQPEGKPQGSHSTRPHAKVERMNTTAWRNARKRAGLADLRVHDLRHTFASRLRLVGIDERTVADLMWHEPSGVTRHYMRATVPELQAAVDKISQRFDAQDLSVDAALRAARRQLDAKQAGKTGA